MTQMCLFKYSAHMNKSSSVEVGAFCCECTGLSVRISSPWIKCSSRQKRPNGAPLSLVICKKEINNHPLGGRMNKYLLKTVSDGGGF